MPLRLVWRPGWYAWALLGLIALGATYKLNPERLHGPWIVVTPLLIAGAVLALRRLWELPPAWTLCGAIALTIFSNGWSLIGLGGLPLNRLLIVVVLLQFALRAPGVASVPRLQVRNVHLLMCLTMIYALASAAAAGTLASQESAFPLVDILGLVPFLLFFLAPSIFAEERERNLLLATLVGLGVYLGTTAIFESIGPHALVFPSYILVTDQASPGVVQASGPFQSPVAEGFAVFACAVASIIAFLRWRVRWQRYVCVFSAVTCLFACFATLERGVWLAAVVAAVVTAATTRTGRRWLIPGAFACAIGIGAVLTVSSQLSQHTSERANYRQSVWDRQNQMAAGIRMIESRPLLGFGWDRYRSSSEDYFRQPSDYPMVGHIPGVTIGLPRNVIPLHNTYLAYAVELGLIGLLLWMASLLVALVSAIATAGPPALRSWKLGLLAIAVFFLIVSFFDPHEQPFPIALLLLWAGVAYGQASHRRSRPADTATRSPNHGPQPALLPGMS
jgi:putative inorganic carbon (hco3(-)) transporter